MSECQCEERQVLDGRLLTWTCPACTATLRTQLAAATERAEEAAYREAKAEADVKRVLRLREDRLVAAERRATEAEDARDGFAHDLDAAEDAKREAEAEVRRLVNDYGGNVSLNLELEDVKAERDCYRVWIAAHCDCRPEAGPKVFGIPFLAERIDPTCPIHGTPTGPQSASPREGGVA